MAILLGPLYGDEARGKVADVCVFKRGKFHPIVSSHFHHQINWTPAKISQAANWRSLCDSWRALSDTDHFIWSAIAPGVLTGFNYFMQLSGSFPEALPYEPPSGDNILFNFTIFPYTPPSGGNINFTF